MAEPHPKRDRKHDTFALNPKLGTGARFREFCNSGQVDASQVKVATRLIEWFMDLEPAVRLMIYNHEMRPPGRARLALAMLELYALEDRHGAELATQALKRIAQREERDEARFETAGGNVATSMPVEKDSKERPESRSSPSRRGRGSRKR